MQKSQKKLKFLGRPHKKHQHFQYCRKDIVKGMGSCGDTKPPDSIQNSEIDSRKGAKDKPPHCKRIASEKPSIGKKDVMVGTEQHRRN